MDKELRNSKPIIKQILMEKPITRNSQSFLELEVLKVYAKRLGLTTSQMNVDTLFMNRDKWKFPKSETIRRNRQHLVNRYPELGADDPIDAYRLLNEERVRDYMRNAKYEA